MSPLASHDMAARVPQSLPAREQERESKMEVTKSFCDLVSEVPAHVFYCSLFIGSKAVGLANTRWEGMTKDIHLRK